MTDLEAAYHVLAQAGAPLYYAAITRLYLHFPQPRRRRLRTSNKPLLLLTVIDLLLTLHERPLVAPVEGALWPDRDALRWHREQCLRP